MCINLKFYKYNPDFLNTPNKNKKIIIKKLT